MDRLIHMNLEGKTDSLKHRKSCQSKLQLEIVSDLVPTPMLIPNESIKRETKKL